MTWERFQIPLRLADDRPDPALDEPEFGIVIGRIRYVTLRLIETSGDPRHRSRRMADAVDRTDRR